MSRSAARFALLLSLVGLCAAASAAFVHYRLLFDPTYTSFCDISSTVSCTQVYMSRYSTFAGIPLALFGGSSFIVCGLLAVAGMTARPTVRESVPGYLFVLSTLSLAVVLYLGYVSFFLLKAVCILCLITYAAVIGLFLISGAAATVPMSTLPRRAFSDLRILVSSPLALVLVVVLLGGAASAMAFFPREAVKAGGEGAGASTAAAQQPTDAQKSEFDRWYASQPRVPMVVPMEGAKVLVVKFNDYQCPPCRQSFMAYKDVFAKFASELPGQVKLVLRDFPLDGRCNVNVQNGGPHPAACDAAVAVRLSRANNKAEAMEEWLFANQPQLTPVLVRQAAKDIGGVADYDAKWPSTLELVKGDVGFGKELGVRSTPTFFINGVKIEGALPPQYFEQAIRYELQRAGGK